jgi:hypothetical protein
MPCVLLVGSLSHLGTCGLRSYTEDLVRCLSSVGARVGTGSEVIPFVPVPLGGIDGAERVRDLFDLDSWILGSGLSLGVLLRESRPILWGSLRWRGVKAMLRVSTLPSTSPAACETPRIRVFHSQNVIPRLPAKVELLRGKEER